MTTCNVCAQESSHFAVARVLAEFDVNYYRCADCGFIQTEEPYWLGEAYSEAISASDLWLVGRNLTFANISQSVIGTFFDPSGKFLDYGGGYGLLVRIMRDRGLDFYRYDKHCANLFARGFDAGPDGHRGQYELLTAFEVLEHLVNPRTAIRHMLEFSPNIFFSTLLIPSGIPKPSEWSYYALESGQHVSLYTLESLRHLASENGLQLVSDGLILHLLTKRKLSKALFKLVTKSRIASLLGGIYRRSSLLPEDYRKITGRELGSR